MLCDPVIGLRNKKQVHAIESLVGARVVFTLVVTLLNNNNLDFLLVENGGLVVVFAVTKEGTHSMVYKGQHKNLSRAVPFLQFL